MLQVNLRLHAIISMIEFVSISGRELATAPQEHGLGARGPVK